MSTPLPTVSVVVPVHDGARYLGAALESLLRQVPPPDEVIVVDDGSTDDTAAVAARAGPRVRVRSGRVGGAAAARNAGIAMAQGDLLGFLDHDDLWVEGRLARQVEALRADPSIDGLLGLTQRMREDGETLIPMGPPSPEPSLGALLVRRSAFLRVGLLDETRRYDEDVDWFLRAREANTPIRLDRTVVQLYRRHETNATKHRAADVRAFFEVLRDSIARRRDPAGAVRPLSWWPMGEAPPEAERAP